MADQSEQKSDAKREPRLGVADWKEQARARLGVSPHAVVGALSEADADEFTEAEVRKALTAFEKRTGVQEADE